MNTAQAAQDPIALLWRIARVWMAGALQTLGGPAEIALQFAAKARAAAKRRLKALESLVMKLLLAEAARLSAPSTRPGKPAGRRRAKGGAGPQHDLLRPETWRVRFRLRIPPEARLRDAGGPRIRDLGPPRLVTQVFADMGKRAQIARLAAARRAGDAAQRARTKALKLARRFEALRRVLADPRPHALRLQCKLRALGRAAFAAARRIAAQAPPRGETDPAPHQHADLQAWRATFAFPDSS